MPRNHALKTIGRISGPMHVYRTIALRKIQTEVTAHFLENGFSDHPRKIRLDHGRLYSCDARNVEHYHESNRAADALSIEIISGLSRFRQLRVLSAHTQRRRRPRISHRKHAPASALTLTIWYRSARHQAITRRRSWWNSLTSGMISIAGRRISRWHQGRSWVGRRADLITQIVSELSRHIELAAIGLTATPHPLAQYQQL